MYHVLVNSGYTDPKRIKVYQLIEGNFELEEGINGFEHYQYEGELPDSRYVRGKQAELYFNKETNSLYVEYSDRPLTPEEEIEQLKEQVMSQQAAINMILGV